MRSAASARLSDNPAGAAAAFYASFSFVPVPIVVTSLAGWTVGRGRAEQQMFVGLQGLIGASIFCADQFLLHGANVAHASATRSA